jgi:hypothetical protein
VCHAPLFEQFSLPDSWSFIDVMTFPQVFFSGVAGDASLFAPSFSWPNFLQSSRFEVRSVHGAVSNGGRECLCEVRIVSTIVVETLCNAGQHLIKMAHSHIFKNCKSLRRKTLECDCGPAHTRMQHSNCIFSQHSHFNLISVLIVFRLSNFCYSQNYGTKFVHTKTISFKT